MVLKIRPSSTLHFQIITAQKVKLSIKECFSKCDQIRSFLRIWSHLLKKYLIEEFTFCALCFRFQWTFSVNFLKFLAISYRCGLLILFPYIYILFLIGIYSRQNWTVTERYEINGKRKKKEKRIKSIQGHCVHLPHLSSLIHKWKMQRVPLLR